MNMKFSYFLKCVLALGILVFSLTMEPKPCLAADEENTPDMIEILNKDTVYEYDLNGDGATEKLQYKLSGNEDDYKTIIKFYINDKLFLTKEDSGFSFGVRLLDLDQSDNILDLFIFTSIESDCVKNAFFARYDGEKLYQYKDFEIDKLAKGFNTYRYSLARLDGDGKFTVKLDTPIYSPAIGCYYCYMPFQLKDNTISALPAKSYTLTEGSSTYQYKAAKSFSVYETVGSKKAVFKVKKGAIVTFHKLYVSKSGKAYFKLRNSKGKTGWIKSDQENLFVMFPAWG